VLAELFAGAVEAGFEGDNADAGGVGHFLLAAAFLGKGDEGAIGGFQFGESMAKGVEFFTAHGRGGFGNFEVFLRIERGKESLPALAAEVIDAGVTSHAKQPRLKLGGLVETWKRADHFDENGLGEIFDGITASGDGIDETGDAILIGDNQGALRVLAALLRLTDYVRQRRRFGNVHARAFGLTGMTKEVPESCAIGVSCKLPVLSERGVCKMHVS
jgi:hypothetical protein